MKFTTVFTLALAFVTRSEAAATPTPAPGEQDGCLFSVNEKFLEFFNGKSIGGGCVGKGQTKAITLPVNFPITVGADVDCNVFMIKPKEAPDSLELNSVGRCRV
ncbi:uncharacterized protein PpBr36_09533 [Pyricularia pennisetigena]|uniref:uncharacterized protein n=1 Tax=Pyricularia pennisetigena TaxID=1578925 RepID=UPI00114EA62B|nr:uncharacterized protein PpBr36_09533 [Pyricularia pennisetigena]TLS22040.1 hypothetical protein PpBr36_09533 [Pyricularia pennisetigena]